jgi:hypothetical protein
MPYMKDRNDDEIYIPSAYAKEELPTWNEFYNEFYKPQVLTFNPTDDKQCESDLYWKLPHRKLLLGWVCNQLNKMLFEDNMKENVLAFINNKYYEIFGDIINDIHFILKDATDDSSTLEDMLSYNKLPIIYTCELPTTGKRSIFASEMSSKNIKNMHGVISLQMVLKSGNNTFTILPSINNKDVFWDIVRDLIISVIAYFSDLVGWKDAHGNLIDSEYDIRPGCGYQAGFDAAI